MGFYSKNHNDLEHWNNYFYHFCKLQMSLINVKLYMMSLLINLMHPYKNRNPRF